MTKPFLKWVGGKTQILQEVLETFPSSIKNYHEPFLGGGSVLLGLLSSSSITVSGKIYASDLNPHLIGLYRNVQSQPENLIMEVQKIVDDFSRCEKDGVVNRTASTLEDALTSPESYYFWVRSQFNALTTEEKSSVRGSAMLLFMNKTCFRGVYREGPRGFNVPFGNYKNPCVVDAEHIRTVSVLVRNVVFTAQPFTDSLATIRRGDFVYMDPPYAPENETSFVSYTAHGFSREDHDSLFTQCHTLVKKGATFVMSNADVGLVRDAFPLPNYETRVLSCRRAIHSKNPEARTNEVLISSL
jgi:DNA adenine methylase